MEKEERELAVRIFEKAMDEKSCLERYELYSVLSVRAAKAIYFAIKYQTEQDLLKLQKKTDEEFAEVNEKYEKKRDEEKKKNTKYFLVYKKEVLYSEEPAKHTAFVTKTSRDFKDYLSSSMYPRYLEEYLLATAVYMVSKQDADRLLELYKKKDIQASRELKCTSYDDFMRYVSECQSAEHIDLTDCKIRKAELL